MKSILVIDTPKSCHKCELIKSCKVVPFTNTKEEWDKIHPQCPLQDTTELLEALNNIQEWRGVEGIECDDEFKILQKALGGTK